MIRCSAPLPEGPLEPVLARMLEHAPYQVPSEEDKGRNKEAESGLHTLLIQTRGISYFAKEGDREGEFKIPSLPREEKGRPGRFGNGGFQTREETFARGP